MCKMQEFLNWLEMILSLMKEEEEEVVWDLDLMKNCLHAG